MASYLLDAQNPVLVDGHVVLLQVNAVGYSGFSFSGSRSSRFCELIERLADLYGEDHECVYYMGSVYPGCDPEVGVYEIRDYRRAEIAAIVGAGMFYLPPRGWRVADLHSRQAFGQRDSYGDREKAAISALSSHVTPKEFVSRSASPAVLGFMATLAESGLARSKYRRDPRRATGDFRGLSGSEVAALSRRRGSMIGYVTSERPNVKVMSPSSGAPSDP